MPSTARLHLTDVPGFFGTARCYQLDPPRQLGGKDHEYVTVVVQPRLGQQAPEVRVYPAHESGACATTQLLRRVGSFTPDEPIDLEGCYAFALLLLGGYLEQDEVAAP